MRSSPTATLVKVLSLFRLLPSRVILFNLPHHHHHHHHLLRQASAFGTFPSSLSWHHRHPAHHHHRRIILPDRTISRARQASCSREFAANIIISATTRKGTIATRIACASSSVDGTNTIAIMPPLTYAILSEQNATTTNAIIGHYASSSDFASLSESEGEGILRRDDEDASKLQRGIDIAKDKGVLDPDFVPEEYISIDVLGKSPGDVADEILGIVRGSEGGAGGGVVVLCGLSGTGKGTTVATLQEKLTKEDGKEVVCWSNGNVFRSVTLLAVTWCEMQDDCDTFDPARALTKENLASFMGMLEFGKFNGKFDTKISGLGLDLLVSEVQNTALKDPKVSKNIPTVAEVTQGEVVLFASYAIEKMGEDGIFVLLEGREQTVNYVRTPLRFTLTLSDMSLIGKRRAAQRLAAGALGEVGEGASEDDISRALDGQLAKMVMEV